MFEVGFTEIILILGLALLVLGPEKLPGLADKVGRWTGRARAMARQLRSQLEQEVTLEELAKSTPQRATSTEPAPAETIHSSTPTDFNPSTDIDTSPEAMHAPRPSEPVAAGTPESDAIETTPQAMHGISPDKAQS
jgi:sec-independent protein translocase protein TatB